MSTINQRVQSLDLLQAAVLTGDRDAILRALPEPPGFLSKVFGLEPGDRDRILTGVFSVFDTDEDRWEIIEAAAMDRRVPPSQNALLALAPHIPLEMIPDLYRLLDHLSDPALRSAVQDVLR